MAGKSIRQRERCLFGQKIPDKYSSSIDFVNDLFEQTGVLFVPGKAFGTYGEGYVRIALIQDIEVIEKTFAIIAKTDIFK